MGIERRKHPRYRIDMSVILHVGGGGRTVLAQSFDLSSAGIFVLTQEAIAGGSRVEMAVIDAAHEETYFLAGIVVHVASGRGLGIQFSPLSTRTTGRLVQLLAQLAQEGPPLGPSTPEASG